MNGKQRVVLGVGLAVMAVMLLFPPMRTEVVRPPWKRGNDDTVPAVTVEIHYRPITTSSLFYLDDGTAYVLGLAWPRLRLQWLAVVLTMLVFFAVLKDKGGGGDKGDGGRGAPEPDAPSGTPQPLIQV